MVPATMNEENLNGFFLLSSFFFFSKIFFSYRNLLQYALILVGTNLNPFQASQCKMYNIFFMVISINVGYRKGLKSFLT